MIAPISTDVFHLEITTAQVLRIQLDRLLAHDPTPVILAMRRTVKAALRQEISPFHPCPF